MSITRRIHLLVALIAIVAGSISAVGIWKMTEIGAELTEIAKEDIPLTSTVTKVTVHQLEQAILMERILRAAGVSAWADFERDRDRFLELAAQVDREILEGEDVAAHALEHAHTEVARAEFQRVGNLLKQIETEHHQYDEHAKQIFALVEQGKMTEASDLVRTVEQEQEKLDHELETLLFELEAFTQASADKALADEQSGITLIMVIAASGIFVGVVLGIFIGRSIARPIREVTRVQTELAEGNLDAWVPEYTSPPEVANLCKAMYRFKQETRAAARYREEQEQFRADTREEQRRVVLDLADNFENAVGGVITQLSASAEELNANSSSVNSTAGRVATRSQDVRDRANAAGEVVSTVTNSVQEISRSVQAAVDQVSQTAQLASEAAGQASDAADKVASLNAASAKINDIVALISDIAEQTNLLALNATIEAARAGDAGKGFAVVANEVKSLAAQTQRATDEIASQVGGMLSEIEDSTSAVNRIAASVDKTNAAMADVSGKLEMQASTTTEVSRAAQEAFTTIQTVIDDMGSVAEEVVTTQTATEQLQVAVQTLSRNSGTLMHETQDFIGGIRSDDDDGVPEAEEPAPVASPTQEGKRLETSLLIAAE